MWWTKDNKRPYRGFKYEVPLNKDKELWFSAENNRIAFFTIEVAEWCREREIEWFLEKIPLCIEDWMESVKKCQELFHSQNIKNKEEIDYIVRGRLERYNIVATFKTEDDAALFKLTWC